MNCFFIRSTCFRSVPAVLSAALLSACGWVDSGGSGSNDSSSNVSLDDPGATPLTLLEEEQINGDFRMLGAGSDGASIVVQSMPVSAGDLPDCQGVDGFTEGFVADSLLNACSDPDDCSPVIEYSSAGSEDDPDLVRFEFGAPTLKAPVGVRYNAEVVSADGRVLSRNELSFCLVAINESPDIEEDSYRVVDGELLNVPAATGLLANDKDDLDVRNQPLSVVLDSIDAQVLSTRLDVAENGAFVYEPAPLLGISERTDVVQYEVSDGFNDSVASAVQFTVVPANLPPELIRQLPIFDGVEGAPLLIDLTDYVEDPEEQDLFFSLAAPAESLSDVELDDDGVLEITPGDGDAGSHVLAIEVSDGDLTLEFEVQLEVDMAPAGFFNEPPVFISDGGVFSQVLILGSAIRALEPTFVDPEDDELTYSIVGGTLPRGVALNVNTGVVSGRPRARIWVRDLRIQAEDPWGDTAVSSDFDIRVR